MTNLRPTMIIAAIAAAALLVCATAPSASQKNLNLATPAQEKVAIASGVTSDLGAKPSPRAPHVRRVTIAKERSRSAPAPVPIQHSTQPQPPTGDGYTGSVARVVCAYHWSCGVALCIVERESGGDPRAYNPSSGAAGWWQWLPDWYRGHFDPFDPIAATAFAWHRYQEAGWQDWHSDRNPCY